MKKTTTEEIIIASDYLSSNEITSALKKTDIDTKIISDQEEIRSGAEPIIMMAYTLIAIDRGVNLVQRLVIPLIKNLIKAHKFKKPEGKIIVKFPHLEAVFPFDLSEEDFEKQIEKIKALIDNPKIFITKNDED